MRKKRFVNAQDEFNLIKTKDRHSSCAAARDDRNNVAFVCPVRCGHTIVAVVVTVNAVAVIALRAYAVPGHMQRNTRRLRGGNHARVSKCMPVRRARVTSAAIRFVFVSVYDSFPRRLRQCRRPER